MSELRPPIGVPRVYAPGPIPVLYPGERATSLITPEQLQDAVRAACAAGAGRLDLSAYGWLVEPSPGWHGRYLRWRYRLLGRWVAGPPQLVVDVREDAGTT